MLSSKPLPQIPRVAAALVSVNRTAGEVQNCKELSGAGKTLCLLFFFSICRIAHLPLNPPRAIYLTAMNVASAATHVSHVNMLISEFKTYVKSKELASEYLEKFEAYEGNLSKLSKEVESGSV